MLCAVLKICDVRHAYDSTRCLTIRYTVLALGDRTERSLGLAASFCRDIAPSAPTLPTGTVSVRLIRKVMNMLCDSVRLPFNIAAN